MNEDKQALNNLIGKALASNSRLSGGSILLNKYRTVFSDWIDLMIAEARMKNSQKNQRIDKEENS